MDTPIPWHRLFGIALTDLFTGRPWRVELEKELALKSQRLDVLIIERRQGAAPGTELEATAGLPDGLDDLAVHNVLTYKSHRQALDAWALDELLGHFVTYRKLVSIESRKTRAVTKDTRGARPPDQDADPGTDDLLPEDEFRLYAVATRMPDKLFGQIAPGLLQPTPWPGVHVNYRLEIPQMSYTLEDFRRDNLRLYTEHWQDLPADIREFLMDRIPVADRLRGLSQDELLRGLAPEDRLRGLDPELVKAWLTSTEH